MNESMNGYTHEQLVARIEALQEDIQKKSVIISNVTEALQKAWESGEVTDDLIEDLQSWLPLETTETTEITITVSWMATVTHKRGYDLQNLSVDVADPEIDGDDIELGYIRHYETEIDVY